MVFTDGIHPGLSLHMLRGAARESSASNLIQRRV